MTSDQRREKNARNRKSYRKRKNELSAGKPIKVLRTPPKMLASLLAWQKKRRQTDPSFRVKCNMRSRVSRAIKAGGTRLATTMTMVGCTVDDLRKHIESLWQPGMNWENYTIHGWHIDHIKPCSLFDLRDPEQQKKCFHFTNLQPLWAKDNYSKGNRFSV